MDVELKLEIYTKNPLWKYCNRAGQTYLFHPII